MLAVLTIFIMIIFVLGSGLQGADFFQDVLPRWFGGTGKTARGPKVATVFGEGVYRSELYHIQDQRALANEFMVYAMDFANTNQIKKVSDAINAKRLSLPVIQAIEDFVRRKLAATQRDRQRTEEEIRTAGFRYQQKLEEMAHGQPRFGQGESFAQLRMMLLNLEPERKDNEKEADYQALLAVYEIGLYDARRLRNPRPHFIDIPNNTLRDALIFKLVLAKADQMGIRLPRDYVNDLINRETRQSLNHSDTGQIKKILQQRRSTAISDDLLLDVIGNEFRVRTALTALGGDSNSPAFLTPYEFFQFYKDNLSETFFNMIKVSVQDFVAKVAEQPSEDDLKKLFEAKGPDGRLYKLEEPDPTRPTPGFKEPRRVKLAWIGGDPNLPIYGRALPVVAAVSQVAAGMAPPDGGGVAGALQVAQPLLADALPMHDKYQAKVKEHQSRFSDDGWFTRTWVRDTSIYHPLPAAALVAQLAGPPHPLQLVNGVGAALQQAVAIEVRDRAKVGVPAVLAPATGAPMFGLLSLTPAAAAVPAPLPLSAYAGLFREELREERLYHFFTSDMKTFQDRLQKFRTEKGPDGKERKPDEIKAEVAKYVDEFIKVRSLQNGTSTEPRDKYTIATDPGLAPLVTEKAKIRPGDRPSGEWGPAFFGEGQFIPGFGMLPGRETALYEATWFPQFSGTPQKGVKETSYLAWKTEDVREKSFINYAEAPPPVKERVKAAWFWEKARALAKQEADKLAEKARAIAKETLATDDNINGFRGRLHDLTVAGGHQFTSFDLPAWDGQGMSVLVFQPAFQAGAQPGYRPYSVPPSENIPYPGAMTVELLEARNKPLGETIVLNDQPQASYYVASLVKKREKQVEDFTLLYGRMNRLLGDQDPLYRIAMDNKALPASRQALLERIKAEAKYTEDPEGAKDLDKGERDRGE